MARYKRGMKRLLLLLLIPLATLSAADSGLLAEFKVGIERLDPDFDKLVAPDAQIEKCAEGFNWSEGPTWFQNAIVFSDVPENVIYRWAPGNPLATVFLKPSGSEKLRPLEVTSRTRSHVAPDIPTVIEANLPYLVAENFIGVSAPANLPAPVLAKLHAAIQTSLDDPQLVARLNDLGLTVRKMSQAEFAAFVQQQVEGWAEPVKASGASLN